jgi:DNA-binding MarR family transcriptional regulator
VADPAPQPSGALLPELSTVPGHLFWRASARVTLALPGALPPGVDIHAYAALLALAAGEARSQQWLADTVSVSRTTMTKIANALAEEGLVERVRNPADRRSYALTRTPAGARAAREWQRHAQNLEAQISAGFTAAEREELRDLLQRIARPGLSADTPGALLDSIGFLVTRMHARIQSEVSAAVRDLGIEPRHIGSLIVLRAAGPIPQAELARYLGVSGASIVEIVDHLERRGLVERRRLETDRRAQLVHLLPAATELVPEAKRRGLAASGRLLAPLSAPERRRLVELLARFVGEG